MKIRDKSVVYAYTITLCMGSFVFGYELTSFGNLSALLAQENHLTDEQVDSIMTYFNLIFGAFTLVGIVFYQYFKQYGWMRLFKVTDLLTIIAGIVGLIDLSIDMQSWSRIIFGFVTGINTILVPTFLTSILPGSMGAPAGTLNQFFIVLGIFSGFWMGFLVLDTSTEMWGWRLLVGLPIIPALLRIHFLQNYFPYQALQVLTQTKQDEILQHYLDRIYIDVSIQEFLESKRLNQEDLEEEKAQFFASESKYYRMRFAIAMAIAGLNQLSGGAALAYFAAHKAFHVLGCQKKLILSLFVFLHLLHLVVTLLAGQLIERYGRRPFMLQGQRLIILCLFLIAFIEIFTPSYHMLTCILIFVQIVGFGASYGPSTFLIGTEVVNDIFYPAILQMTLITFNFVTVGPMVEYLGIGPLCLIYLAIQLMGYIYFQSYQIQTQGKLRRDVYRQFRMGNYPDHRKQQIALL